MEDNLDYSKDLILRMNRNIYPAFTDNVKRECVISPDIADRQKVTLNNILEGSNSEQFNIICSNSNIISNNFIVGYESLKFTLQKVQYSWNASANWGFGGGYSLSNFLAYTSPLTAQSSIVGLNANSVAFYDDSDYTETNKNCLVSTWDNKNVSTTVSGFGMYKPIENISVSPALCKLDEMRKDKNNNLGYDNRYMKPTNVVFTKSIPSPNYTFNVTQNCLVATQTTTTMLYTIEYNGEDYPSNVDPESIKTAGLHPSCWIFGYDKANDAMNKCNQMGYSVGIASDVESLVPNANYVALPVEPANQSLTISFQYDNVEAPLINDVANTNSVIRFTNKINIIRTIAANPEAILKSKIPHETDHKKHLSTFVNSFNSVNYQKFKDIQISLTRVNPYLYYTSYTVPQELKISDRCLIPYMKRTIETTDMSNKLAGKTWKDAGKVTLQSSAQTITQIPYGVMLFVNTYDQTEAKHRINRGGACRAKITNIALKMSNAPPILNSLEEMDLCEKSIANGLRNYDETFFKGKYVDTVQNNVDSLGAVTNYINTAYSQLQRKVKKVVNGSIIYLRFGEDIPLDSTLVAGTAGVSFPMSWTVQCESDSDSKFCELNIVYLCEHAVIVAPGVNGVVDQESYLTRQDVAGMYKKWNSFVDSKTLYMKASTLRIGSGLFDSTVAKLRSILPKTLAMTKRLVETPSESVTSGSESKPLSFQDLIKKR